MSRGIYDKQNKVLVPTAGTEVPNVDSTLSSTSTNPVQNSVIKAALDTKADISEIQTLANSIAPTENGTNYSTTYYKGDEFYRNGTLYKVTASSVNSSTAINTGSGGNADEAPSVIEQMYAMPHTLSTGGAVSVDETGIITASDGYFVIKCSYAAGNYVVGLISDTRIMAVTAHDTNGSMATYPTAALFVRKGTRISATSNTFTEANNTATFYPLV